MDVFKISKSITDNFLSPYYTLLYPIIWKRTSVYKITIKFNWALIVKNRFVLIFFYDF